MMKSDLLINALSNHHGQAKMNNKGSTIGNKTLRSNILLKGQSPAPNQYVLSLTDKLGKSITRGG